MWALRSIAHHYDPAELDIIVAGHLPDWLHPDTVTGVHVRQHHNRAMLNVWNALTAVAELIGDGPFVLMNDDFFATSTADLETLTNRGPAAEHVEAMRANRAGAFYRSRLARSVRLLEEEGRTDPASWETHTPLPTTGAAVRAVGNLLRSRNLGGGVVAQRTLLGDLGGLPGRRVADPKVYTHEAVPIPSPWVSTSPVSWHGATGEAIRGTYITPSPWEVADVTAADAPPAPQSPPSSPTPTAPHGA